MKTQKRKNRIGAALMSASLPLAAVAFGGQMVFGAPPKPGVALVASGRMEAPANYGLAKLRESLEAAGFRVVRSPQSGASPARYVVLAGLSSDPQVARVLRERKAELPEGREALAIRRFTFQGKPALVICGSDARGLMYAALDVAERTGWAGGTGDLFRYVREISESPYLLERGISMYTMQRAYFESRLYDENYWKRYFDLLARSRINAFTVIFGYENGGFMAPPYPYFFDVPAHPTVRLVGITHEQQARNTAAFRSLIRLAHERGIAVIPAIWDHIYRGGVQSGGIPGASEQAGKEVPGLVVGLSADNLAAYSRVALQRFLETFPEIDGLEFRMHPESGLKRDEMEGFWHEVFGLLARFRPGLLVTLRAKELPDSIIEDALKHGLNARIETKYWMEQMGLPFHPTHINRQNQRDRRHGYADLLRYPQRYRVHWRLWSGGTARLLLWADPEYVRRFAESARLYGGNSFDVNEMLATKMLGEPHDKPPVPILNAPYRHYDYEFERYWHYYQVWGRISYNPNTPSEVWEREFQQRFGPAGPSLMKGLHLASRILPRIVAAAYRYQLFPTTRGWAEMMRQGDLPEFAGLEGSDIEQFMNPRDAARSLLSGTPSSLRRPEETSAWFTQTAAAILQCVRDAEAAGATSKEAVVTLTDLKILAGLGQYYAARLPAAVHFQLYRECNDPAALERAIEQESKAVAAWEGMVKAAGSVYAEDLAFGVHRVGFPRHWREELGKLRQGLEKLRAQRENARIQSACTAVGLAAARHAGPPPRLSLPHPGAARPRQDLEVTVVVEDPTAVAHIRLRYRHLTQTEDYQTVEMTPRQQPAVYVGRIPGSFITPQWDLMYFVEAIGKDGSGRNYPDLEVETPYVIVPVLRPSSDRLPEPAAGIGGAGRNRTGE